MVITLINVVLEREDLFAAWISKKPSLPGTIMNFLVVAGATISLHSYCSSSYNSTMKTAKSASLLDQLVAPLGECLTQESARRLHALKADPNLYERVDDLAGRHSQALLTPEEQAEYGG